MGQPADESILAFEFQVLARQLQQETMQFFPSIPELVDALLLENRHPTLVNFLPSYRVSNENPIGDNRMPPVRCFIAQALLFATLQTT